LYSHPYAFIKLHLFHLNYKLPSFPLLSYPLPEQFLPAYLALQVLPLFIHLKFSMRMLFHLFLCLFDQLLIHQNYLASPQQAFRPLLASHQIFVIAIHWTNESLMGSILVFIHLMELNWKMILHHSHFVILKSFIDSEDS
jgi:hypothetical protein